jgi:hypothetical protein
MCSPGRQSPGHDRLRYRELLGRFCHAACFGDGKEDIQLLDALAFHPGYVIRIARSASFPEQPGAAPNFDPGNCPALVLAPSRPTIEPRRPHYLRR